jgi:hypothetical protein
MPYNKALFSSVLCIAAFFSVCAFIGWEWAGIRQDMNTNQQIIFLSSLTCFQETFSRKRSQKFKLFKEHNTTVLPPRDYKAN